MTTTSSDGGLPPDDFSFWFALKLAVDAKDWPLVSEYLESSPAQPTPRHTLTIPVLHAAVLTGRPAIAAALLARGFVPVHDDLKTITDQLEFTPVDDLERVAAAFDHVIKAAPDADIRKLVGDAWRRTCASVVVPQLAAAGIDVLLGGDAVDIAIDAAKPELMQLLIEQGMSPFAPKMLRAVFDDSRRDEDTHKVWWMAACAHREARAALARFEQMQKSGDPWHAAAFINPIAYDKTGAEITLLGILCAYGRVGEIFDARHWQHTRDDALKLHDMLAIYGMKDKVSLAPFVAGLNRTAVQARTRNQRAGKFKL